MPPPTVSELARLFGVREDDPGRLELVEESKSALKKLNRALSDTKKCPDILAEFLSLYVPSLLDLIYNYDSTSRFIQSIVRLLAMAQNLKIPHSLRALLRLEDADGLPTRLVERIVDYPLDLLDALPINSSQVKHLSRDLSVLLSLLVTSLRFGPASHCSFHLLPELLDDLERVGTHYFATPYPQLAHTDESASDATAKKLRSNLEEVLGRFGIGSEAEKYAEERKEMLECGDWERKEKEGIPRPRERFWCELSKREMDRLPGREEGLLLCSGCCSVAYCSEIDQKKNWKKHKLICFKPSWTQQRDLTVAGGVEVDDDQGKTKVDATSSKEEEQQAWEAGWAGLD